MAIQSIQESVLSALEIQETFESAQTEEAKSSYEKLLSVEIKVAASFKRRVNQAEHDLAQTQAMLIQRQREWALREKEEMGQIAALEEALKNAEGTQGSLEKQERDLQREMIGLRADHRTLEAQDSLKKVHLAKEQELSLSFQQAKARSDDLAVKSSSLFTRIRVAEKRINSFIPWIIIWSAGRLGVLSVEEIKRRLMSE